MCIFPFKKIKNLKQKCILKYNFGLQIHIFYYILFWFENEYFKTVSISKHIKFLIWAEGKSEQSLQKFKSIFSTA